MALFQCWKINEILYDDKKLLNSNTMIKCINTDIVQLRIQIKLRIDITQWQKNLNIMKFIGVNTITCNSKYSKNRVKGVSIQ